MRQHHDHVCAEPCIRAHSACYVVCAMAIRVSGRYTSSRSCPRGRGPSWDHSMHDASTQHNKKQGGGVVPWNRANGPVGVPPQPRLVHQPPLAYTGWTLLVPLPSPAGWLAETPPCPCLPDPPPPLVHHPRGAATAPHSGMCAAHTRRVQRTQRSDTTRHGRLCQVCRTLRSTAHARFRSPCQATQRSTCISNKGSTCISNKHMVQAAAATPGATPGCRPGSWTTAAAARRRRPAAAAPAAPAQQPPAPCSVRAERGLSSRGVGWGWGRLG